jgi:hypothetical protein
MCMGDAALGSTNLVEQSKVFSLHMIPELSYKQNCCEPRIKVCALRIEVTGNMEGSTSEGHAGWVSQKAKTLEWVKDANSEHRDIMETFSVFSEIILKDRG